MASMGGVVTISGLGAYHGSKFALLGLGDTLAQVLALLGIKVTSVMPGVYRSDCEAAHYPRRNDPSPTMIGFLRIAMKSIGAILRRSGASCWT
jgi:short-subunit dehydrogenase